MILENPVLGLNWAFNLKDIHKTTKLNNFLIVQFKKIFLWPQKSTEKKNVFFPQKYSRLGYVCPGMFLTLGFQIIQ